MIRLGARITMKTNEKICRAAVTLTAMIISVFGAFSIADKIDGFVESQKRHETKAELAMTSVNKISEKAAQSVFEKRRFHLPLL